MRFKVYRNGRFLFDIETMRKNEYRLEPIEDIILHPGDILIDESGGKLEVITYNPIGKIRPGITFKQLE